MTTELQRDVYDRHYAGRGPLVRAQLEHPLFASFYDRIAARLLGLAAPGRDPLHVVELGCGEGLLAAALHREASRQGRGIDYVGADLSEQAVTLAAGIAPGRFLCGDAAAVAGSLAGRPVDLVVVKNLLHHLEEPHLLLAEAHRLVGDRGHVVAIEAKWGSPQAWLFSLLAPRRERLFFVSWRRRNAGAFARAGVPVRPPEVFSWLPYELLFAIRVGWFRRALSSPRLVGPVTRVDEVLARRLPALGGYDIWSSA